MRSLLFPILALAVAVLAATFGPGFLVDVSSLFGHDHDDHQVTVMGDRSANVDGTPFPDGIKTAGSTQSLVGGGTRSKWGFRVYVVGIYAETKLIKKLKKTHGGGADDVSASGLSREFAESKLARTLLLHFRRAVRSSDVAEALGEALIDKVGEETSSTFQKFILDMVQSQGKEGFDKESELYITCKGEKLWASTSVENASVISIKGLCSAVFMAYLGDNPVSPPAKEGFEKGFTDLAVS